MRFLESFSTFFATVGFVVFSGIIVFFVLVNTMSSEMHRGWQNFLTNFARYFQQISFKKRGIFFMLAKITLSVMAILHIFLIATTDYEKKVSVKWKNNLF